MQLLSLCMGDVVIRGTQVPERAQSPLIIIMNIICLQHNWQHGILGVQGDCPMQLGDGPVGITQLSTVTSLLAYSTILTLDSIVVSSKHYLTLALLRAMLCSWLHIHVLDTLDQPLPLKKLQSLPLSTLSCPMFPILWVL